ncbi:MAG: hypothetical protein KBS95_08780 [Alistipes sp.]|nr:hypothetical protein [Candidatus Alistipes equi]
MPKYILIEVSNKEDEVKWLHADRRFYKGNRNWVCPLDCDIRKIFDPKSNEMYHDGDAIRWYLLDETDNSVAGRIAAFYTKSTALANEQPTGGCGFFECVDDQKAANIMFDAARDWLIKRGMEAMDGPINFGSRDSWWGLLVDGYEHQPLYANPYNPPYYKSLFENYGFQNYFNQNTYIWRLEGGHINDLVFQRAERLLSNPEYHIENIRGRRLEDAAEDLRIIYNKAWSMFTGVKSMEKEEAQAMLRQIKPIIDPDIIYFAYYGAEPIGFFVMVPDINRVIGKFNGKFGLINKLRLIFDLKIRKKCDRIFGIIFGITPEFQGKGVESAIMQKMHDSYVMAGLCKYATMEFAWIGDFNPVMNRMIEKYVMAQKHKMHTTYRYLFDRTKEFHRCPRLGLKRRDE